MPPIPPHLTKNLIAAAVFGGVGIFLATVVPSVEIAWVMAILLLTIYLFAFEIVGVDVAAVTIMILLGLTGLLHPLMGLSEGLVPVSHLFSGFSSNAVISIMAVMIIGAGLDRAGCRCPGRRLHHAHGRHHGGAGHPRHLQCGRLYLQFHAERGRRSPVPASGRPDFSGHRPAMSRLLMPMGFCAILGGTITMVGSSPLSC